MKLSQLVLFLLIFAFSACVPATPSKEDLNDELESKIADEKILWEQLQIANYQSVLSAGNIASHYRIGLTVKDNAVADFEITCMDVLLDKDGSICNSILPNISPDTYTIEALFDDLANSRTQFITDWRGQKITSSWSETLSITFNPEYHYPQLIWYDLPEASHEEYGIEIESFTILQVP